MTGQIPQFSPLGGGLDLVTPAISKKPGTVIGAMNYEPTPQGYRRIGGFERYDGQPKPSEQTYWILDFTIGIMEPLSGALITGVTSGAIGTLIAIVLTGGSWVGGDAAGYFVIRLHTGIFQAAEDITISQPVAFTLGFSAGFR